jgi:hypothetical protein
MRITRLASCCIVAMVVFAFRCAAAEQPAPTGPSLYLQQRLTCPDALLRGCCCLYCPKPMPCVHHWCGCNGPDDYCRKLCPCVPCYHGCSEANCYCRKPMPCLCRPLGSDYYTCVAGSAACACSDACRVDAIQFTHAPLTEAPKVNSTSSGPRLLPPSQMR